MPFFIMVVGLMSDRRKCNDDWQWEIRLLASPVADPYCNMRWDFDGLESEYAMKM
jgi:hypothetical protein